jgi:hypothetical protein
MRCASVLFLLSLPLAAQPSIETVLAKLGSYSTAYHKNFRQFVASEERTQKHWGHNLKLEQRSTVSDYYVVSLPSAPSSMVEFRETLSLNGRPVKGRRGKVLEILNRKSSDRAAEADRITKENKRYDLGPFRRFEEFTNMGLLYVDPRVQRFVRYQLVRPESGNVLELRFREPGPETLAREDGRPAPATGVIYFTYPEVRVLKVDLRIHLDGPDGPPYVRCIVEYEPGPEDLMLPSLCRHFIPGVIEGPAPGAWESEARYTNYRRFTSDVKLTVGETIPTAPPAAPGSR